jgi:hypothetical protein
LGFLVVGHTHEDIDGCFGYLSKKLKEQSNYYLANLMKAFMVYQEQPLIPYLIQEILDFKTWVQGYLKDDAEVLVGHTYMQFFCFFVDSFKWPMMQCKLSPNDKMWSSKEGLAI